MRDRTNTPTRIEANHTVGTIGRVLFALPFAVFGVEHLLHANEMAGLVPVPGGAFWIYFTGVAMIAGAFGILTKILGRYAAFFLAALLLVYVATIHIPNLVRGVNVQMTMINLLKDVALTGASLTWASLFGLLESRVHVVDDEGVRISRPRYSRA